MKKNLQIIVIISIAAVMVMVAVLITGCGDEDSDTAEVVPVDDIDTEAVESDGADTEAVVTEVSPPADPVRLVFVHHSVGEGWLSDDGGGLGQALMANNYFVSDTNYGWGPEGIGDTTDIGNWYNWFAGPDSGTYTSALYAEDQQNSAYSRLATNPDPAGENQIIMFKSCFPNSALGGSAGDAATTGENPLRGEGSGSEFQTVANAKGIYNDLLDYFATRQDKLFVVITAPPLSEGETDAQQAANARAFNTWLAEEWLADYPYDNVVVFDFYNVLTSNGGSPEVNDLDMMVSKPGNHHRYWNGGVAYTTDQGSDFAAYALEGDSHPTAAGGQKATTEFIGLLNYWYGQWAG